MKGRFPAFLLAALMTTMSFTIATTAEDTGRQMDVDCSGYTFEDLFEYNNAVFEFAVLDDWATSDLYANSWVNESRAAVVRANMDTLFEGFPGGNNEWLSTDERDAIREIGPKCIADMYTRIGIREGLPHRGGVDWNDVEFVEDGIGLEEVNLIPDGHQEERSCAGRYALASQDCREVPTTATNNLEISMFVKDGETHNSRFNQLPNSGQSDFTVAMNATNVTSATMEFTFPFVEGMRMANWTIEDDGTVNLDAGSIAEEHLPDGSVKVILNIGYDKADWPMIRNIFFDMTTTPPAENDVPVWVNPPEDNTIIPIIKESGEVVAITGETIADWASDDDAWGLDCNFTEEGWSSRMNSEGELLVISGSSESGTAECSIIDPYGATNNATHTWRFGQPASFSAMAGIYSDAVDVETTPSLLVQNLAVGLASYQNGDGPVTNFNLGSSVLVESVSLSGMSPGEFMIHVTASSNGMLDWDIMLDLSLEKKNTPPVLTVDTDEFDGSQATWSSDQYSFSLSGTAIDPDGGDVDLSATMCGDTTTSFTKVESNWDVSLSTAKCVAEGKTQFDVVLSATDSAGDSTSVNVSVADPNGDSTNNNPVDPVAKDEGGLPSIGMFATIISMLGAALLLRRD
jgi:hypothetical protein